MFIITTESIVFYIQVNNPGNFIYNISGAGGYDVDAICWGPFTSPFMACTNGQLINSGSIVDCSYSTSATEIITIPNGISGQFYLFMVTNYSNTAQNLVLNQSGGTGNATCDSTHCAIPGPSSICFVTADSSNYNEIYFNHVATKKGTVVYRQNSLNNWDSIGYVPGSQPDVFVDTTANSNQQSYVYSIAHIDTCGNLQSKSPSHKTILLQTSQGIGNQINLTWNAYIGAPVVAYKIYRGPTPTGLTFLNQVSNSTYAYTDLSPLPGVNYYKIMFTAPSCTSNAIHDTLVGSNYKDNSGTTNLNSFSGATLFNVYPNPAQNKLNVYGYEIALRIELTNLLGETVITLVPKNNLEIINTENLSRGVYLVKITDSKGTSCRKVVLE